MSKSKQKPEWAIIFHPGKDMSASGIAREFTGRKINGVPVVVYVERKLKVSQSVLVCPAGVFRGKSEIEQALSMIKGFQ